MTIFAVLGAGKMGEILACGVQRCGLFPPGQIVLSDINRDRLDALAAEHGFGRADSNSAAVGGASTVLLSVKPQDVDIVLAEIAPVAGASQLLISIVAGVSIARLEAAVPGVRVVRAMPNAPAAVGAGITAICGGASAGQMDLEQAEQVFAGVGRVVRIAEPHLDAVTALSGSGPAYFALFVEAIIDAGVMIGLPRSVAHELAVQTVVGTGALMNETPMSPAAVREAVTSPGGTTAMAVRELERAGLRSAILEAVQAAWNRAKELGRPPEAG